MEFPCLCIKNSIPSFQVLCLCYVDPYNAHYSKKHLYSCCQSPLPDYRFLLCFAPYCVSPSSEYWMEHSRHSVTIWWVKKYIIGTKEMFSSFRNYYVVRR
jgi:hypothetical protein